MQFSSENLKVAHEIPALEIKPEKSSNVLIGVAKNPEYRLITTTSVNILTFKV
jgi:hypothetical protein